MVGFGKQTMKHTILLAGLAWMAGQLAAQPKSFAQPPGPRDARITAIAGVIADGAQWKQIWQGNETADGIAGTDDGGLLMAQEQTNRINKLDKNDKFSVFLTIPHGPGAVAIGPKGRILITERTCTDPGGKPDQCTEPPGIAALTPTRTVLADKIDGKGLGRVNDLTADKKGGAYFTSGGAFYVSPSGKVSSIGENLRTNGIILSPDEKTLYITNGPVIAAFDVQPDGSVKNQREFGKLDGGVNGDGMAVDSDGRLYVTTNPGIQVLGKDGKYLGSIPTPRNSISVAFSGPGKKTLYVSCLGAVGPDGQEVRTPAGVRNTAMTVYKVATLAQGFKGRPK
jgi:gluconolactonase